MTENSYDKLIERLDAFIRKYYKNQLIRGGIYFCSGVLILFLAVIFLEYFGHYHSGVRAVLFYFFLGSSAYFMVRFIAIPLSRLLRIGKTISYEEASEIIGRHFPHVQDKLLNTLQLKIHGEHPDHFSFVMAAINQKIDQLKPVPFNTAIDFKKNLKYARYVLFSVLLYVFIYMVSPGMIRDGGQRVLQYNQTFKVKAPFEFIIENKELKAEQFADFKIDIAIKGKELPNDVYLIRDGNPYKMEKVDLNHFSYTFNSLKDATTFNLQADAFISDNYRIEVIARPQLLSYQVHAHYPSYLHQQDETFNSPGDLNMPAGTLLDWKFVASQTDQIELGFNGPAMKAAQKEKDIFTYSKKLFISTGYYIKTSNEKAPGGDSMQYTLTVIPDAFPAISVDEKSDSVSGKERYFIGDATDDHGLTNLTFNYRFVKSDNKEKLQGGLHSKALLLSKNELSQRFYHQFSLTETGIEPSDEVEYYFEVWDNDGVHGSKSSRSRIMLFKAASVKELEEKNEAGNSAIKDKMEEAIREAKSIQKDLKALELKMQEKRELTWEEKKKLDKLLERERNLSEKIDQIKKEQKNLADQEQEFKKHNEELAEKQRQIEKLFNEVMNDEMKKLIQQLEQLMQQQNKDKIKEEMEKMELSNKDVEKELDRMLEQFKQLEVEKKLEDAVKKLDQLSEKQNELSKKSEELGKDKKSSKEEIQKTGELKKEQEKLAEEFGEMKKEIKDIEEKNKELEQPNELENTDKEQEQIEQDMKESGESLDKGEPSKSSKKQKEASDKMKEMSSKMKKGMESQEEKELELNTEALREILENVIQFSKDQEDLMEHFKGINGYSPEYVEIGKEQRKVRDNAKIIEDSLLALSKRVAEISSFINREVSKLNHELDGSIEGFSKRDFREINTSQQSAMMHANNLGVMLSDVLKQLQEQQMQGKGKGGGKPSKGKGQGKGKGKSMGSLKQMQEELNRQLREGMNKNGSSPGDKNGSKPEPNGKKPGEGQGGMGSEEYARRAAQQMAIRQQMQKMLSEMDAREKEQMGGNARLQEMQKMMEQTEKELYNKRLSNEMIQRQEEILTRLLESEKAEKKQEQDKKREAEQAKEKPRTTPPGFEPYIKQKQKEQELLETIPAEMQPYYKEKAKEYFNKVGK